MEPIFRSRPEPSTSLAIALVAIVTVALSTQLVYSVANRGPTIFGARSQVLYEGSSWVETQSERVNSRTLLEPVALAHMIEISDFEANWIAGQVPGTQILQFEYHDADPEVAQSVVESVTGRYLAEEELAAAVPNPAVEAYMQLENDLLDELAVIEADIAELEGLGVSARLNFLFQEKASIRAAVDAVRLQRISTELFSRASLVPQLVSEPFVLSEPVGPLPARRAVFGFLGGWGLAIGLGLFGLRTAANRRELPHGTFHSAGVA